MVSKITITTVKQGLHDVTSQVLDLVANSGLDQGLCTLYMPHTSASLLIQENYDPSARVDLETWLNRLVPENDPLYTHTLEGADDMPAHIKSALTAVNVSIPIFQGQLALGQWQGIFLWEHRKASHQRQIIVHLGS